MMVNGNLMNLGIIGVSSISYFGLFLYDPSWLTAIIAGFFLCCSTIGVKVIDIVYKEYVRRKERYAKEKGKNS
jgi:hypothetical protein